MWFRTALLEDNTTGTLQIRLLLSGETENAVLRCTIDGLMDAPIPLTFDGKYHVSPTFTFPNIRPWRHEAPNLYHAVLTLTAGEVQELIPYDIGALN